MDPIHLTPRGSTKEDTGQPSTYQNDENEYNNFEERKRDRPNTSGAGAGTEKGSNENFLSEIFKFAIIALVIVIPFRMFIAQPFIVSGASMSPTFETGQYLIVDQVSYQFDNPERGEVVIFKFPEDTSKFFIKRIIGLPGETIEIRGSDVIIKNATESTTITLDEPYLKDANRKEDFLTITLSENEFFVMGDNRAASSDSRVWGPVTEELIVGRALIRLLPIGDLDLFPGVFELES